MCVMMDCVGCCLLDIEPVSTTAEFSASGGLIELPRSLFRHSKHSEDAIEMTVITEQPSGLLLWQAQTPSRSDDKDFIAVAIENGKVQFRFCLLRLSASDIN